ncbi:MAG: enoyl-CoA hydratase/isomerase family protein [Rhodobacterales bacterium]|nr:MAG: enoyl-CoA hydratase/isomerase family protein [Rhodobacterales bacterium]
MTSGGVDATLHGGVLVLTLAQGPSNALTPAVRAALIAALATRPKGCVAVVLAGAGVTFSSHVPLEPDRASPSLQDLCQAVEGAAVPVVAALHGLALGPGAELLLAASARVGQTGSRIAFPEVAFGLCPAGGSTRRLARLIGAEAALQALVAGRVIGPEEALALGLLDAVAGAEVLPAAIALAEQLARGGGTTRRAEDAASWQAAVAAARRAHPRALPAARRIIDCIEAALLLPAEAADRFEAVTRADLEASDEAAGLCAAALADRRAARLPAAVARAEALPLTGLGLAGEGAALVALARAALQAGIAVRWLHPSAAVMAASLGMPDATGLTHVDDPAELVGLALQVHARAPASGLRRPMGDGTALLVLDGAEGEMGLSLAPTGRLAEVAVVAEEAPRAIATAIAGLRQLHLAPMLVGHPPGIGSAVLQAGNLALAHLAATGLDTADLTAALAPYGQRPADLAGTGPARVLDRGQIAQRWLAALAVAGLRLLAEGRARRPSDIDHALVAGHGFARWQGGPMHLADRRGLMVLRRDLRLWAEESPLWTPPPLLDRLIRDGLSLAALNEA